MWDPVAASRAYVREARTDLGSDRQTWRRGLSRCDKPALPRRWARSNDGVMAGRDDARIFADACLWVQEAQTGLEVLRRANDGARLLVETTCSYCAVRDGEVLRLVAHSGFRDPETARRWSLPVGKGIGGRVVERGETIV